jgi:hypothetical protein
MELVIGLFSGGFAGIIVGQRHLAGLGLLMISAATALVFLL